MANSNAKLLEGNYGCHDIIEAMDRPNVMKPSSESNSRGGEGENPERLSTSPG